MSTNMLTDDSTNAPVRILTKRTVDAVMRDLHLQCGAHKFKKVGAGGAAVACDAVPDVAVADVALAGDAVADVAVPDVALAGDAVASDDVPDVALAGVAVPDVAVNKERDAALKRRRERAEASAAAAEKRLKADPTAVDESSNGTTCGSATVSEPEGDTKPVIVRLPTGGASSVFIDLSMDSPLYSFEHNKEVTVKSDVAGNRIIEPIYTDSDYTLHSSAPLRECPIPKNIGIIEGNYIIIPDTPPQSVCAPIIVDPSPEATRAAEEEAVEIGSPVAEKEVVRADSPVGSPNLFEDPHGNAGGSPVHLTPLSATSPSSATETNPIRSMMVTPASSATIAGTAPPVYPDGSMFVGPVGEGIIKFAGFGFGLEKKE